MIYTFVSALTFHTSYHQSLPACLAVLPEQDEFHLGGGALNDGRCVLVTPPIKNLVVNLMEKRRQSDEFRCSCSYKKHEDR